jgi:hypothetical protein
MEVHAPHKPLTSWPEIGLHLAIVTVGILIALSLEGLRQWHEHRGIAAEARTKLEKEITANREELEKDFLARESAAEQEAADMLGIADSLMAGVQPVNEFHMDYPLILLQSASRSTAEVTGAFGYMEYDEVQGFAAAYQFQQTFERLHQDGLTKGTLVYASGKSLVGEWKKKGKVEQQAVTEWKRQIIDYQGSLRIQSQIGRGLDLIYARVLGEGKVTAAPAAASD